MHYCVNKMCFLCLTDLNNNKTTLVTYKNAEQNSNNENTKILLFCHPELKKLKLDFPIYICCICKKKLTSYYNFKVKGYLNYNRYLSYLDSLKGENKEAAMKNTNLNVQIICNQLISNAKNHHILDNLIIKNEEISENADDLIQIHKIQDEILNRNAVENNKTVQRKTKNLLQIKENISNNNIIKTENILNVKLNTMSRQISQNEMEYFEINETKTELSITHEIYEMQNINNTNNKTKEEENDGECLPNDFTKLEYQENEIVICENMLADDAPQINLSNRQQRQQYSKSSTKSVRCLKCLETFKDESELENHLKIHCNKILFKCAICLKTFNTKNSLSRHLKTHYNSNSYICSICSKKFNRKDHLKVHSLTHTEEKPYNCSICSKKFKSKTRLIRHNRLHTKIDQDLYNCSICSKKFSDKAYLVRHSRLHTGEKPYNCSVCSKKFSDKSNLRHHYQLHTGEKPYNCSICSRKFHFKSHLSDHTRTHTGEKPYSCLVCSKKFTRNSNLTAHLRMHSKKFSNKSGLKRHC